MGISCQGCTRPKRASSTGWCLGLDRFARQSVSSNSFASRRSAVSKPSVNQP